MPFFQDLNGALHFLSDADVAAGGESLLPVGCVSIADAAAEAIQKPPTTAAEAHAVLVQSALTALAEDDAVAVRCVKAGVAYPAEWLARDVACRAIVNGEDKTSTEIPARPSSYPAGT